jgi:pentatricopeptide repeat protein
MRWSDGAPPPHEAVSTPVGCCAARVAPDVITFSATISACEKGGQWQRALALLDEMRAARVAPDVITSQRDHLGPLRLYCVDPQQSEGLEVEQLARCVRQH